MAATRPRKPKTASPLRLPRSAKTVLPSFSEGARYYAPGRPTPQRIKVYHPGPKTNLPRVVASTHDAQGNRLKELAGDVFQQSGYTFTGLSVKRVVHRKKALREFIGVMVGKPRTVEEYFHVRQIIFFFERKGKFNLWGNSVLAGVSEAMFDLEHTAPEMKKYPKVSLSFSTMRKQIEGCAVRDFSDHFARALLSIRDKYSDRVGFTRALLSLFTNRRARAQLQVLNGMPLESTPMHIPFQSDLPAAKKAAHWIVEYFKRDLKKYTKKEGLRRTALLRFE